MRYIIVLRLKQVCLHLFLTRVCIERLNYEETIEVGSNCDAIFFLSNFITPNDSNFLHDECKTFESVLCIYMECVAIYMVHGESTYF